MIEWYWNQLNIIQINFQSCYSKSGTKYPKLFKSYLQKIPYIVQEFKAKMGNRGAWALF